MSGQNDDAESPGELRTDDQPAGQQPAGQQAAGQPAGGQQAAGRAQPSVGDLVSDPATRAYVKFAVACFGLVGVAVGLGVVFVGFVGGNPLSSSLVSSLNGLAQMSGASVDVGPTMDQLYVNRLAFQAINTAPVAAGVLGVATGLYVAGNLDGSDRHSYVASALGGGVGAFVLVFVVGALASVAIADIPVPEEALESAGTGTSSAALSQAGISASDAVSSSLSTMYIGGTELAFETLAFNAAAVGVGVAVVSVGAAYVSRELAPTN
ncbi:hypothetical protein [Halobacterium yunchengense]|uniref:hypothetical protein n=1 Tax=Halobacterium yunchengense TaxID=3108497 RepID=UPI0030095044